MHLAYLFNSFSGEPTTTFDIITQISYSIVLFVGFITTVVLLRESRPVLVYTLFLLFSTSFYIGVVIAYFNPETLDMQISDDDYGYKRILHYIFSTMLTYLDYRVETVFVAFLMGLVAVPQIMAYLISGLFGCASRPRLISFVTEFSVLSISKTMLGLAGFVFGTNITLLIFNTPIINPSMPSHTLYFLMTPFSLSLSIASIAVLPFMIISFYYLIVERSVVRLPRILMNIHSFMSRHKQNLV